MPHVAISYDYSDTLKSIIKHAHAKALRRHNALMIKMGEQDLFPEPETAEHDYDKRYYNEQRDVLVPFAVLVWDSGLDWNADGTPYQDDCPGDFPHTYHHTRDAAEREAAWLEHTGTDPRDINIVANYWVPFWDAHRIPQS